MKLSIGNGRVRLFRKPIVILTMGMVIFGSGFVVAGKAEADIVTWEFSGTVMSFDTGFPGIPGIKPGDLVTGTVVYDTNALGTDLGYGTEYILNSPPSMLVIVVAGMTFSSDPGVSEMRALVSNNWSGLDSIIIGDFNGVANTLFEVHIRDEVPPLNLLSDESLPTMLDFAEADESDPEGFGGNQGNLQYGGIDPGSPVTALTIYSIDSLTSTVISAPVPEREPLALYDDFKARHLDPNLWFGSQSGNHVLETIRRIPWGRLKLVNLSYGNTDSNFGRDRGIVSLRFIDPASVRAIAATVKVARFKIESCEANSSPTVTVARISGAFFNTGTPIPGSAVNDVFGSIDIRHRSTDPPGVLQVRAFVFRCNDPGCFSVDFFADEILGTVKRWKATRLRLEWDPNNDQFIVQRDEDPEVFLSYGPLSDSAPPGRPRKRLSIHNFVPNCPAELRRPFAFMRAYFDNVFVNESAAPVEPETETEERDDDGDDDDDDDDDDKDKHRGRDKDDD